MRREGEEGQGSKSAAERFPHEGASIREQGRLCRVDERYEPLWRAPARECELAPASARDAACMRWIEQ